MKIIKNLILLALMLVSTPLLKAQVKNVFTATGQDYTITGQWAFANPVVLKPTTVAGLPPASTVPGGLAAVLNGATDTDCAAGGGTYFVICVSNEQTGAWIALGTGQIRTGLAAAKPVSCSPADLFITTDTFVIYTCGPMSAWTALCPGYGNGNEILVSSCQQNSNFTFDTTFPLYGGTLTVGHIEVVNSTYFSEVVLNGHDSTRGFISIYPNSTCCVDQMILGGNSALLSIDIISGVDMFSGSTSQIKFMAGGFDITPQEIINPAGVGDSGIDVTTNFAVGGSLNQVSAGTWAGTCTLGTNCAITFGTAYSHTPICVGTDQTAIDAVRGVPSTGGVTFTGNSTDVVAWICVGNPN